MTEEMPVPEFDREDVSISRVQLVHGSSKAAKGEDKWAEPGDFILVPDKVKLTLNGKPGFTFVVEHAIKDRILRQNDGRGNIVCHGARQDNGPWYKGTLLKPEAQDARGTFIREVPGVGEDCFKCSKASDVRDAPNFDGDWKGGCRYRFNYLVRIIDGLPEGLFHPYAPIMSLQPMSGRPAAKFMSTILARVPVDPSPPKLYQVTFRMTSRVATGTGGDDYLEWACEQVGGTEKKVMTEIEKSHAEFVKFFMEVQKQPLLPEPEVEGSTKVATDEEGDDLPF